MTHERPLDFRRWPFWGTADVVVPEACDPTQRPGWPDADVFHAKPWLRRGGRVVVRGQTDSLTIRHGESDAHWVARRRAAWFNAVPPAEWHGGGLPKRGSIVATRAILRVLAALHDVSGPGRMLGQTAVRPVLERLEARGAGIDPALLGLPAPAVFTEPIAALLRHRIGRADHVDWTVSATIAALDVNELLGRGALRDGVRRRLERWLLAQRRQCSLEDRLTSHAAWPSTPSSCPRRSPARGTTSACARRCPRC
jgi:hypothetical protein